MELCGQGSHQVQATDSQSLETSGQERHQSNLLFLSNLNLRRWRRLLNVPLQCSSSIVVIDPERALLQLRLVDKAAICHANPQGSARQTFEPIGTSEMPPLFAPYREVAHKYCS